ncbi:MAG: glucosaminidase domain-containing protein [Bernardetiaceae bacterium]|nr:glucosaminidase domain-containing protein [Bernardetiaceae bacterium]
MALIRINPFSDKPYISRVIAFEIPIWRKRVSLQLVINDRLIVIFSIALTLVALTQFVRPTQHTQIEQVRLVEPSNPKFQDDAIGYSLAYYENLNTEEIASEFEAQKNKFLMQKQLLITDYLIKNKVARLEQLKDSELLTLNREISQLFIVGVLDKIQTEKHVYHFLTDTTNLRKIETALMEQVKFNIPASIKLSQAALETAYGRYIVHNNFFGIKDKNNSTEPTITTEYYNEDEMKLNKSKIISSKRIEKNGRTLYKCKIKDSFAGYKTPWESFRAHSVFLHQNLRYSPLFTKGKDYRAWADRIGSTKYGGVGYATSPIYGELLKKIIERYCLDLLDH